MAESVQSNSSTGGQDDESNAGGGSRLYSSSDNVLSTNRDNRRPIQVQVQNAHIFQLPPEILTIVFRHLNNLDMCRATRSCTAWRDVAYHPTVWRNKIVTLQKVPEYCDFLFPSLSRRGIRSLHVLDVNVLHTGPEEFLYVWGPNGYIGTEQSLSGCLMRHLSNVTDLSLFGAKEVTDQDIMLITDYLKKLVRLNLRDCHKLTDDSLENIANRLPKLKWLNLDGCNYMSDDGVECLVYGPRPEQLPVLEFLGLRGCMRYQHITDDSLICLSRGQANLVELDLAHRTDLTDIGLQHLANMDKLTTLNLSNTNIGSAGIAHLVRGGSKIIKLNLSNSFDFDDDELECLGRLTHLLDLNLSGCGIWSENLEMLVMFGSKIQILDLTDSNVSDDAMEHVAQLKDLRELRFDLGDEGLGHLAAAGSQVAILEGNQLVTDLGLQHLAQLTNLRQLSLCNSNITCEGLVAFFDCVTERMTNLKLVSEMGHGQILLYVAQRLFKLETLELSRCFVDDEGKAAAARNLPRLCQFFVDGENIIDQVRSFGHPGRIM